MLGCSLQPLTHRLLFDAFDAMNRCLAIAISQHRQALQNGFLRVMAAVKNRSFGFAKRLCARFTLVALHSFVRPAEFAYVLVTNLCIVRALWIPTK